MARHTYYIYHVVLTSDSLFDPDYKIERDHTHWHLVDQHELNVWMAGLYPFFMPEVTSITRINTNTGKVMNIKRLKNGR